MAWVGGLNAVNAAAAASHTANEALAGIERVRLHSIQGGKVVVVGIPAPPTPLQGGCVLGSGHLPGTELQEPHEGDGEGGCEGGLHRK